MSSFRYRAFRAYQHLPEVMKKLVGSLFRTLPRRLRYGTEFVQVYNFLLESQYWTGDRLLAYQLDRLREQLLQARQHVPYYRQLMQELDIDPEGPDLLAQFKRLPLLDKQGALDNQDRLVAENIDPGKHFLAHTSASTNPLMKIPRTAYAHIIERAYLLLIWNWGGYQLNEPAFRLRATDKLKQFSTYDGAQNCVEFSPTVIDDQVCLNIAARARSFRPKAIFGYPSLLFALADGITRLNLEESFASVKVCFCASEKTYHHQRQLIASAFTALVSQWYGMGEQVCLAGWCPQCECLHEISQYSLVEYHPATTSPDGPFNVIGTSLVNDAFPLMRYQMDDLVELTDTPNRCGRPYPSIKEVHGRAGDFLITPTGALISPTSLEFVWDLIPGIKTVQIQQHEEAKIDLLVVPLDDFTKEISAQLLTRLSQRIGKKMEINLQLVDTLSEPGLKQRLVISTLSQARFATNKNQEK